MRKEIEINGCVEIPCEITTDEFADLSNINSLNSNLSNNVVTHLFAFLTYMYTPLYCSFTTPTGARSVHRPGFFCGNAEKFSFSHTFMSVRVGTNNPLHRIIIVTELFFPSKKRRKL